MATGSLGAKAIPCEEAAPGVGECPQLLLGTRHFPTGTAYHQLFLISLIIHFVLKLSLCHLSNFLSCFKLLCYLLFLL